MPTPWILDLHLPSPSLADNTADAERLETAAAEALAKRPPVPGVPPATHVRVARELLPWLPMRLPRGGGPARALLFGPPDHLEVLDVAAHLAPSSSAPPAPGGQNSNAPWLGLAVDLGTTRIAARLLDLATGDTLGETSVDNPQGSFGADILMRIHHAASGEGLRELHDLACQGIQEAAAALLDRAAAPLPTTAPRRAESIRLITVAGNTAMTHLLLGLPPRHLIREPYVPVVNRPGVLRARDVGLEAHPAARLYAFPNVGSYFGGDLIAGILASGMAEAEAPEILVDVGTNAEVALGTKDWIVACAGAAGPALEGGVARMGMAAAPGAVDRVWVEPDGSSLAWHTLEDAPPRGICGSGLIDLAACLFRTGRIDLRGRLVPSTCGGALRERDNLRELVVVDSTRSASGEDLTLGQPDLDSLIRSKAAMYTILETLTAEVGLTVEDAARIQVAGTFGQYIDVESAITIGMLPDLPRGRFSTIGNSALAGAAGALTEPGWIARAEALRDRITYVELNVNQAFMARYSAAKFLPHTDPDRFPSVARAKV